MLIKKKHYFIRWNSISKVGDTCQSGLLQTGMTSFFFTKSQQTMMLQVSAHPIYLTIFSVRSTCPLFEEGCYMFTLNFLMQFMSVKKKRIENSHSDYKYQ